MRMLETLKAFFTDIGTGLTFSPPEERPHHRPTRPSLRIWSPAYIKSPEAQRRRGFSAGAFAI
ncbi:MAG: hypothetical protein R2881_10200 [Eubacteriales bacterium]